MNFHESDLHIKAAAYLYSIGKSQKELAAEWGISQPTVSRLIAEARNRDLITTVHHLSATDLLEIETILYPRYRELHNRIEKIAQLASAPSEITLRVFGAGQLPTDGVASLNNREIFAASVGQHLHGLLDRMKYVGVTWGKTLASIVQSFVSTYQERRKSSKKITFFPVCGEAVDFTVNEYSASTHVAQLSKCVNAVEGNALSLGSTPARIPKRYDAPNQSPSTPAHPGVREFIREAHTYRRVFLGSTALIHRMDTLLCTAGAIYKDPGDRFMDDLMSMEEIGPDDLGKWTIGDIAGVFIPRHRLAPPDAKLIADINARWMGITIEHIRICADRARKSGNLGVILPAIGYSKAEIVVEVIRLGLVNQLILDHDIADGILSMVM